MGFGNSLVLFDRFRQIRDDFGFLGRLAAISLGSFGV